ncbi:MAG: type I methionyl aminopeptidase, partial [Rickettsiales bacterium]|nr:type I methionyl aminopeptidase [Rickettsiales bacterium]
MRPRRSFPILRNSLKIRRSSILIFGFYKVLPSIDKSFKFCDTAVIMLPSVYAPKDFKRLRAAGDLVARCFDFIAPHIRPGITTGEIDRIAAEFLRANGGRSSDFGYKGFPRHICTSVNDVIVHGIPRDDEILRDGDIVNVDLTAEYKGFHGDASRMFEIGVVSPAAHKLVQTTQDALHSAIAVCAPGVPLSEIGKTIEGIATANGFSVVRDFVGHGIGKVMHDDPSIYHYYDKSQDKIKMVPGLVFTIEPMINQGTAACRTDADEWTTRTKDGKLSAQWEHTI